MNKPYTAMWTNLTASMIVGGVQTEVKAGDRFGSLVVQEIEMRAFMEGSSRDENKLYAISLCDCGNQVSAPARLLMLGRSKSCAQCARALAMAKRKGGPRKRHYHSDNEGVNPYVRPEDRAKFVAKRMQDIGTLGSSLG